MPLDVSRLGHLDGSRARAGRRFAFIEVERSRNEGTRIDVALHWARHLPAAWAAENAPGR
jgi:hypothetical protein